MEVTADDRPESRGPYGIPGAVISIRGGDVDHVRCI